MSATTGAASSRSLFLRFFGAFAATALAIWLAVLAYEAVVIQGHYERVQRIETRAWARQILAALKPGAGDPARQRATLAEILRVRDDMFRESGYRKPNWRLEVWDGAAPLFDSDGSARPLPAGLDRSAGAAPPGWNVWVERDPASGLTVRLSEQVVIAWQFALTVTSRQFMPLLYSIPFLLVPAWFSIRRGLRPVRDIVAAIEGRGPADLAPLAPSPYRELAPLSESVNRLMARLSERLTREREFLSDAAHQLKTPLAVIQANADLLADLARDAPAVPGVRAARAGLLEGVGDAAHVTHQLLALARSGADADAQVLVPCDLTELVRSRLALAAAPALRRGVEIALRAPDSCTLPLHRESAAALIDNLVDNAVKYSPDGACVEIDLQRGDTVRLSVRDRGPGIPVPLRSQVFERFFRVPGQDKPGSGLGLAIVAQVARRHGASIALSDNLDGEGAPGLCVRVEWPAPGPTPPLPAQGVPVQNGVRLHEPY